MSAGTTVWPAPFLNQRGDRRVGLVVKVYETGKGPLPDGDGTLVLAALFTDDALTVARNQTTNPVTIDANGNETTIKAAPGRYDAYVDGKTIPVEVVATVTSGTFADAKARLASGSRLAYGYDDFDRADGVLSASTSPSSDVWFVTGPGGPGGGGSACSITDGKVTGASNFYAVFGATSLIKRWTVAFSFGAGAGTDRSLKTATVALDNTAGGLANMLHMNFGPDGWGMTKRLAGGAFVEMTDTQGRTSIATWSLLTDGTVYSITLELNTATGTLVMVLPTGERITYVHADVTTIDARFPWMQYTGDGAGYKAFFHGVTKGPSVAPALRALGGGASMADIGLMFGTGLTRRQKKTGTLSGAIGWYRIATHGVLGSNVMAGNVKLTAYDLAVGYSTYWDFDALSVLLAAAPTLGQRFAASYTPAITQARLSRDDVTTFTSALDVYKSIAADLTYSFEFSGAFTVVSAPVVGAVALPTFSTTLVIAYNVANLAQQAANPDTSGATLAALETEVNELKALLRVAKLMAP